MLESLGLESVKFLTSTNMFRPMIIGQSIWKGAGWGTIVFLAAMSGVDLQLYEAAIVDGAGASARPGISRCPLSAAPSSSC